MSKKKKKTRKSSFIYFILAFVSFSHLLMEMLPRRCSGVKWMQTDITTILSFENYSWKYAYFLLNIQGYYPN